MSLDIYFSENIARTLLALSQANTRAMGLARRYGTDERLIAIAETAYQAALDDVGASFGLQQTEALTVIESKVRYHE